MTPILKLLPGLLKTVAKVLGLNGVAEAATAIEQAQIPPEKQVELQEALLEHEKALQQIDLERLQAVITESVAMIQSPDKYVSRARPTMLYAGTFIAVFVAIVLGVVIVRHLSVDWGAVGALTSLMTAVFGAGGYYIGQRTKEKLNGNGNSE